MAGPSSSTGPGYLLAGTPMARFFVCFWFLPAIFLLSCTKQSPNSKAVFANASLPILPGNETDRLSLLAFKAGITDDPMGALSSWDERLHFCRWNGVACGRRHPDRVVAMKLASLRLGGYISPVIANLTFLREIDLSDNRLYGMVHQEIGRLSRLRHLNLSYNLLSGEILANLTHCRHLEVLYLRQNEFTGEIPTALGSLPRLRRLNVQYNRLSGGIPSSLGNLSSLSVLHLGENMLTGGIPGELGRLSDLEVLVLQGNMLSGGLPHSIYNLSKAVTLAVSRNNLSGTIHSDIGTLLPRLTKLVLGVNRFGGRIPISLPNASSLQVIELIDNGFSGTIPANLGRLKFLNYVTLGGNLLQTREPADWGFLASLTNCTRLQRLTMERNQLEGPLPNAISNFSTSLQFILMGTNQISGSIPEGIENLRGLQLLAMEGNQLTGSIPAALGKLENLSVLTLLMNRLSGEIPLALGNITGLSRLELSDNRLAGSIPKTLGRYRRLEVMWLFNNKLSGAIPDELSDVITLVAVNLSDNSLGGSLPPRLGSLRNLMLLDLSRNQLSGELPATIGGSQSLRFLFLGDNLFEGPIAPSVADLKGLEELDLSLNNLTGGIPRLLGELRSLWHLNLSFNNLEGEVPRNGVFTNASGISLIGNPKLCGGISILKLPACPVPVAKKRSGSSHYLKSIIPVAAAVGLLLFLLLCFTVYWMKKVRNQPAGVLALEDTYNQRVGVLTLEDGYKMISYSELLKATNGFSPGNLIGTGSFGSVYTGILGGHETPVAVKVLNCQRRGASKSFMAECEVLKNTRHRNLVKIITVCSSVDSVGRDFKALVFEYMPNGSLDQWLHPDAGAEAGRPTLNFEQRLNIAIDVAAALDYLHDHCHSSIVHCDLKPSNVLLDHEMTAHVSDFGLARFLHEIPSGKPEKQSSTIGIRGTVGYVAPEYGMGGPVTTSGDVYSFGILLLELFTGKRPVDDMFRDGLSLRRFVGVALPDRAVDVIDPKLVPLDGDAEAHDGEYQVINGMQASPETIECRSLRSKAESNSTRHKNVWDRFISLMKVGVACTDESPRRRVDMADVVSDLLEIRRQFQADAR